MRQKIWWWLSAATATVCIFCCLRYSSAVLLTLSAFPFAQIGKGLRLLSLSGRAGNIVAVACYWLLSLLPLVGLLVPRRRLHPEDTLLGVLSAALLGVLYCAVNPGLLFPRSTAMELAQLGGAFWMLLLCYGILRLLRSSFEGQSLNALRWCLGFIHLGLTTAICAACLSDYLAARAAFAASNSDGHALTSVFLALRFAVSALPYALDLWALPCAYRLLDAAEADRFSTQSVDAAARLASRCRIALSVSILVATAFDLLQVLCLRWLRVSDVAVLLPVDSILFVLLVLLLSRQYAEAKQLKDDNDSFI